MKFTALTTLTTLLLSALTLSSASPLPTPSSNNVGKRDVYSPPVLYPTTGTVWYSGQRHNVTWCVPFLLLSPLLPFLPLLMHMLTTTITFDDHRDASSPPASISNRAFILLREDNIELPLVLAHDFDLRAGRVEVTVPELVTGSNYSIVCEYLCS